MKHILKLSLAAAFSAGLSAQSFAAECIAPANPGGGWDFTCRSITKIMTDIDAYDGSIQVTNMAGGGGGLAYTHVVNERNSDDNLIVAASTATATRLAQNAYSGANVMAADNPVKPHPTMMISAWSNHVVGGVAIGGRSCHQ